MAILNIDIVTIDSIMSLIKKKKPQTVIWILLYGILCYMFGAQFQLSTDGQQLNSNSIKETEHMNNTIQSQSSHDNTHYD